MVLTTSSSPCWALLPDGVALDDHEGAHFPSLAAANRELTEHPVPAAPVRFDEPCVRYRCSGCGSTRTEETYHYPSARWVLDELAERIDGEKSWTVETRWFGTYVWCPVCVAARVAIGKGAGRSAYIAAGLPMDALARLAGDVLPITSWHQLKAPCFEIDPGAELTGVPPHGRRAHYRTFEAAASSPPAGASADWRVLRRVQPCWTMACVGAFCPDRRPSGGPHLLGAPRGRLGGVGAHGDRAELAQRAQTAGWRPVGARTWICPSCLADAAASRHHDLGSGTR